MRRGLAAVLVGAISALTAAGCASTGAGKGERAVASAGEEIYRGVGSAAEEPFKALNLIQDGIPAILIDAEQKPYDLTGTETCQGIHDQVTALDLALGPDVDNPKVKSDNYSRGASWAADAALDAASAAAVGILPMRSIVRRLSGAQRHEEHMKHAIVAGEARRGFLKAMGVQHNCTWPAAPLDFIPTLASAEPSLPPIAPTLVAATPVQPPGPAPVRTPPAAYSAPPYAPPPAPQPPPPSPER